MFECAEKTTDIARPERFILLLSAEEKAWLRLRAFSSEMPMADLIRQAMAAHYKAEFRQKKGGKA